MIIPRPSLHSAGAAILIALAGCGGGGEPRVPTTISLDQTSIAFSAIGQTQQLTPSVVDQTGDPLEEAAVSWSSSNGNVATVSTSGLVTAQGPGAAEITAGAGSATAATQVSVVQTPTQLTKISGDGQSAPAGETLSSPLVVQVNDALGHPVAGVPVAFAVTQGTGSVSAATATTGADGMASTIFTTGSVAGSPQIVSASVVATTLTVSFTAVAQGNPGAFNISLQFLTDATASQRQAFADARLRWEGLITGDLEDGLLQAAAGDCGEGTPAVNHVVDDVLIFISLVPIDGPGSIFGGAGPCYIRTPGTDGDLTVLGVMEFDTADLETLESGGFLTDVIIHEMGHVLGFGTLWGIQGLLADPSFPHVEGTTPDPHFTGARGRGAFDDVGGDTYVGGKVPVEDTGGEGTQDSHWRETVFANELMTGFIRAGLNPLSIVTIESLADQGYAVNPAGADTYSLLQAGLRELGSKPLLRLGNDVLRIPIKRVDAQGRVTGILRP